MPCAFLIDELGWQRASATIAAGLFILLLGLPAAIGEDPTGTPRFEGWLDDVDYIVSNWILPLGGLGVALFVPGTAVAIVAIFAIGCWKKPCTRVATDRFGWLLDHGMFISLFGQVFVLKDPFLPVAIVWTILLECHWSPPCLLKGFERRRGILDPSQNDD